MFLCPWKLLQVTHHKIQMTDQSRFNSVSVFRPYFDMFLYQKRSKNKNWITNLVSMSLSQFFDFSNKVKMCILSTKSLWLCCVYDWWNKILKMSTTTVLKFYDCNNLPIFKWLLVRFNNLADHINIRYS